MPFFCLNHSVERSERERNKEVARLSDLTQGKEPYSIPLEMGLAYVRRKFSSVLASPTTANGKGHHGHGGGGGSGGGYAGGAADTEAELSSVTEQWQRLYPGVALPRGLLTKPRDIDFTYVSTTVDR